MRTFSLLIAGAFLSIFAPRAFAQLPEIDTVENTASNLSVTAILPQMLITIKGHNLATSTATATGYPLPTTLGGATVWFNSEGIEYLALLNYASPTQINGVVPFGVGAPVFHSPFIPSVDLFVSVQGQYTTQSSAPYGVPLGLSSFEEDPNHEFLVGNQMGIFSQDTSGCGQAVAYNVHPDGSVSLNTPQNSLDPEKDVGLTFYLTGLGAANFTDFQEGMPSVYNPNDNLAPHIASSVDFGSPGLTAIVSDLSLSYFGPAPGRVGIDQANALGQWRGWPQGCKVPLSLTLSQPLVNDQVTFPPVPVPVVSGPLSYSQLVDVSIQPGGGACMDPPESTLGIVTFRKSTVSDVGGTTAAEAVTAQFIQTDGLGFPQPPTGSPFPPPVFSPNIQGAVYGPFVPPPAQACVASLPNTLDAGALTLSGPGITPVTLSRLNVGGRLTYEATLTAGALRGGKYQVAATGGEQVGAFTANANIPAPISNISVTDENQTTNLQPGTRLGTPCVVTSVSPSPIPCGQQYTLTWTGGDNRSIVTVQFIVNGTFRGLASAYAGTGAVSIYEGYAAYPGLCGPVLVNEGCTLIPEGAVEVIVTQTPYHAPSQPFTAAGLGWGGESTWNYTWDFRGLTN